MPTRVTSDAAKLLRSNDYRREGTPRRPAEDGTSGSMADRVTVGSVKLGPAPESGLGNGGNGMGG